MPNVTFNFGTLATVTIDSDSGDVVCSCSCSCEKNHADELVLAPSDCDPENTRRNCKPVVHDLALNVFESADFPCLFTRTAADMFRSRHYSFSPHP
jgi:hypothetical protein